MSEYNMIDGSDTLYSGEQIEQRSPYGVYIRTDDEQRLFDINSNAFLTDTDGWSLIDEGYGDKYHHAQGNYLPKPSMDERGVYRYKHAAIADLADDAVIVSPEHNGMVVVERTAEEMDADYIPPVPAPSNDQRIADLEAAMTALEEGIASV